MAKRGISRWLMKSIINPINPTWLRELSGHLINIPRFAHDIALIATSGDSLQNLVDSVHEYSRNYGLKINIKKTEVQVISTNPHPLNININNTKLAQVEKFVYLGGTIAQTGSCTEDVQHRIGKALGAFQALNKIWKSKDIRWKNSDRVIQSHDP